MILIPYAKKCWMFFFFLSFFLFRWKWMEVHPAYYSGKIPHSEKTVITCLTPKNIFFCNTDELIVTLWEMTPHLKDVVSEPGFSQPSESVEIIGNNFSPRLDFHTCNNELHVVSTSPGKQWIAIRPTFRWKKYTSLFSLYKSMLHPYVLVTFSQLQYNKVDVRNQ